MSEHRSVQLNGFVQEQHNREEGVLPPSPPPVQDLGIYFYAVFFC